MTFSRAENGSTEFRALSALRENLIGMRKSEGAAAFRLPNAASEIESGFSRGMPSALANENLSSHAHGCPSRLRDFLSKRFSQAAKLLDAKIPNPIGCPQSLQ